MERVLVNIFSFLVFCNLFSPTVAAVLPRQQEDDVEDNNYTQGPPLAGTVILSLVAFILFSIMLTLVIFAVRKYKKHRMIKRHRAFVSVPWANSPALRVNFHAWQSLPSTASLPNANPPSAHPTIPTPEVVEMHPTSPFRTSFPITMPPQARPL